ncbi:unnamed protein product [Prunus armeniaca]|uniref:Uncharacterized protein n=1 Tax=Prunus armeniaca TaxID=36596 RepID=A0A6J5WB45_PRUAR|nr:unnamed protein product [Prunus armeniaca]
MLLGESPKKKKKTKKYFPNSSRPNLTITSLPSSHSTAAPVPSSSNHQPPTTGYVLCLNLFALAVFCSGLRMEASQSNTLNASISTPSIKLETQAQPQTQPQDQQINSVNVGEKRKPSKSVVWLHCKKMIKKDAHGVRKITKSVGIEGSNVY